LNPFAPFSFTSPSMQVRALFFSLFSEPVLLCCFFSPRTLAPFLRCRYSTFFFFFFLSVPLMVFGELAVSPYRPRSWTRFLGCVTCPTIGLRPFLAGHRSRFFPCFWKSRFSFFPVSGFFCFLFLKSRVHPTPGCCSCLRDW